MNDSTPSSSKNSIFISYARADNTAPPGSEKKGWVTHFWEALRYQLTDSGAPEAELWLDRYQIEPQECFTPKIESALKQAKFIVAILSNNWINREWCQKELEMFSSMHTDASDRFIPVFKHKLKRDSLPMLMQGRDAREGYHFLQIENTVEKHDYYWYGLQDEKSYYDLIKKIATLIIDNIKPVQLSPRISHPVIRSGKTIFIAIAASDLRDARQRLVNDLVADGHQVIPSDGTPPETIDRFENTIKDALSKVELVVHLLGESQGITVEGSAEPIITHQLRLTRETSLPRILWAPRSFSTKTDNKRDPVEVVKHFGGLHENEVIYGEAITDLSQWLRQRLKSITKTPEYVNIAKFNQIVVAAAPDDEKLTVALANHVKGCELPVQPYFADDNPLPELQDALVLIPWDTASGDDIKLLLSVFPSSCQVICLQLPGGDEKAKRRFFHENINFSCEKIEALPNNQREGRELLVSMGVLSQLGSDS